MLMVDTCFLIDYQREAKAKKAGPVVAFLHTHADERLQISPVAWGEFLAGFPQADDPFIAFARDRLDLLSLSPGVSSVYRRVYRVLKASGNLIGANDLWIACHAMASEQALVTRNASDFRKVPELRLVEY